jgi:hypothetical protein
VAAQRANLLEIVMLLQNLHRHAVPEVSPHLVDPSSESENTADGEQCKPSARPRSRNFEGIRTRRQLPSRSLLDPRLCWLPSGL